MKDNILQSWLTTVNSKLYTSYIFVSLIHIFLFLNLGTNMHVQNDIELFHSYIKWQIYVKM